MLYYGKGFTHSDIYDMPVYLRRFYYKKLVEAKELENKEVEKQTKYKK